MTSIALDLLYLEPGATGGMETYARSLVPLLPSAMPEATFAVVCGRELAREWRSEPWHPDMELLATPISSASRIVRTAVEETGVPLRLLARRTDLVHGLGNAVPLVPGFRRVVTIHDCIHVRHPETTSPLLSAGMRGLLRANVRFAQRIVSVSAATRDDLVDLMQADATRIDVIPSGPGGALTEPTRSADEVRSALGIPAGPMVLSVSARRPHKNLERLIRAMAEVPDAVLVLPGYPTPWDAELRRVAEGVGVARRVVLCGWVSDGDLEALYRAARCLVFPTLAEGFGLPVLEAMRRSVPVAASDLPVLREVGGEAPTYFDPMDERAIARAIASLVPESAERDRMISRGLERAATFTWQRTAAGVASTYRRALNQYPPA